MGRCMSPIQTGSCLLSFGLFLWLSQPVDVFADRQSADVQVELAGIALLERDGTTLRRPWTRFLDSESEQVRRQALLAMGRLQSTDHLGLVRSKLSDPVATVRQAAAFTYGLMQGANAGQLYERDQKESVLEVRMALVRAIGRVGSMDDAKTLRMQYATAPDELKPSILYALADLNRPRSTVDEAFMKTIVQRFIKQPIIYERRAIVNWLRRSQLDKSPLPMAFHKRCLADDRSDVRQACIGLVQNNGPDALALMAGSLNDRDIGVRIAAARRLGQVNHTAPLIKKLAETFGSNVKWRSLGTDSLAALVALLANPLESSQKEVISTVFQLTQSRLAPKPKEKIPTTVPDSGPPSNDIAPPAPMTPAADENALRIVGEINCASAAILDRINGRIKKTRTCGGLQFESDRLTHWQLLVIKRSAKAIRQIKRLYMNAESAGRIQVLGELGNQPESKARDQILLDALNSKDPHLVIRAIKMTVALKPKGHRQALVDLYKTATGRRQFGVIATLFEAYASLALIETASLLERHADDSRLGLKRAASRALSQLESVIAKQSQNQGITIDSGRRDRVPPPAFSTDEDKPDLRLAQYAGFENALFYTTAGEFLIQFHVVDARQSVKRFIALIKRQFFQSQRFFGIDHGHWIESGDPTNTGYFIPGQLYRPEINQQPVNRGAVGLVTGVAGLDGTKWFISLADKPELDGRVTVIGVVKDGLDVLYRLSPSDRIIRVELLSKR